MKPLFVAFEGIDGTGKTYQVKAVKEKLLQKDIPVITLFAPSDRRLGKVVREVITGQRKATPQEELSAFIEDIADLSLHKITPALQEGYTVLIDRYIFSTWVYQGLKHADIEDVTSKVLECVCQPDLVCVLSAPVDEVLRRMHEGNRGTDKYENKETLQKLKERYDQLIFRQGDFFGEKFPKIRFQGFDSTYPKERITDYIVEEILNSRLC